MFDGYGAKEAKNALWLDHDVSEEGIQCMGQHLVDHSELDTLSKREKTRLIPTTTSDKHGRNRSVDLI